MDFAVHLPLNAVSFGQVSMGILKEMHKRELSPCVFPVNPGNIDLSAYDVSKEFNEWLQKCLEKAVKTHKRSTPIFKLWHLNGSLESYSQEQTLLTFYELDAPTEQEINIIENNKKVLVTSKYTKQIFEDHGLSNIDFVPLFYDKENFEVKDKKYFDDGRITFNTTGKLEKRKNHAKMIKAWAKKYGNNPKYFLQAAIFNTFMSPEDNNRLISEVLENKKYFNINFLGYMTKNDLYNDYLNSGDIVLGCSGGEGWGLPEFHSVGLGKHAVILNATAYKDWANEENAVLLNPKGKQEVYDGIFFHKGHPFNQGNIFDFNEDEFLDACDKAVKRVKANKVNEAGLKLSEEFTVEKTVDKILESIG